MPVIPNIAGFKDAQQRLRDHMGVEVTFRLPTAPVWPVNAALDPQTGRPYDPTVEPESGGGFTDIVKTVALVFRPIKVNVEDPIGDEVQGGIRHGESIALSMSVDDHADVGEAVQVSLEGTEYRIMSMIVDPGLDDRYIAFGEAK